MTWRILHLDSGREMRGGQWQALRLIEGLRRQGADCTLLAPSGAPLFRKAREIALDVRPLGLWAIARLSRHADLVHAHDARTAKRRGVSRRYTFRDVIALRVAAELREEGVSLQLLRKVVDHLRAREGLSATEVLARTNLVTNGERVYEVAGDVTIHLPSGQRTMMVHVTIPLDQVVSEVQRKARALRRAA